MAGDFGDAAAAAALLGPLGLGRARARALGFHGVHARRAAGQGTEFWQYRPLEPGEAMDRVDWRRSARSDSLFLRQREQEDPVRLWLWVDGTGSMDFASARKLPTKLGRARLMAGAIAAAAHAAGEQLQIIGDSGQRLNPERAYERLGAEGSPLGRSGGFRRGDAVLLVGDFLDGDLPEFARSAAASGAVGLALAVIDPAEESFPFSGRVHFEASEKGEQDHELARAEESRDRYLRAWTAHCDRLDAVGAIPGWTCFRHRSDADPAPALSAAADWLRG